MSDSEKEAVEEKQTEAAAPPAEPHLENVGQLDNRMKKVYFEINRLFVEISFC